MHLPPELVHPAPRRFREPEIDSGEDGEDRSRRDDVMEMRDDVVGIVQVEIGGIESERNAGEAADSEHGQERRGEKHRDIEPDRAAPERNEERAQDDDRRDGNDHRRRLEKRADDIAHSVSHMWWAQTMNERKPRTSAAKTSDL